MVTGRDRKACVSLKDMTFVDINERMDMYLKDAWAGSDWRRHELWLFVHMVNRYVPRTDVFKPKGNDAQT